MKILILTDYKAGFGSKQYSLKYRGGFDLDLLKRLFINQGYELEIMSFAELSLEYNRIINENPIVLYQSSEDENGFYKSYIEDIVFDLQEQGLRVLPKYGYLLAHNNKVSMELLRLRMHEPSIATIKSKMFGTIEELESVKSSINYPLVIKPASGAMSKGVALVNNEKELLTKAKKIAKTPSILHDIKEKLRLIKYKNRYDRESFFRKKFIIQNLIPNLTNDWKILVYGDFCYALYRHVRDNDFRASGSGKFIFKKELPNGMLDFAINIRKLFNVPHISLDIAFDGQKFHLIEFQFLYFGTTTLEKSPHYFKKINDAWIVIEEKAELENIYVKSIIQYLNKK